ncbi:hypothetical protein BDD12DRAFT_852450 [Trichophaea hybrida]|nr:hypothetical protein BDD12DRAFT_852450 [Trichophaea hybrida]
MFLSRRPLFYALIAIFLCVHLALCGLSPTPQRRDIGLLPRATDGTASPSSMVDVQNTTTEPTAKATSSNEKERLIQTSKSGESSSTAISAAPVESGGLASDIGNDPSNLRYPGYGLPFIPKVTPGLGVAGVVLMIAGLCCCLIGIKIKRLHIFLSMAYLASLSVTVLIVYVMNPPVQQAIEGAYVTAAIITGCVIGGIAVIFPEVTEGLGCLLGGFCLSMWFLVLKPGGLVTSVYGKLIIIGAFCLVIFSLAFHSRTRPWGLIGSLSFAGATSIILGIDCFSRAGLKEFWLYIWALNDKIFPLGTNTYPHTRGMKVEIAGIFVIFAIGVMSQMKLWKILQERREAKDVVRRQQIADLEAVNEESGKRVEAEYQTERKRWEAAYGDRDKSDSNLSGSSRPITGGSKTDSGLGDDDIRESGEITQGFVETNEMKKTREGHVQTMEAGGPSGLSTEKQSNILEQPHGEMGTLLGVEEASLPPLVVDEDTSQSPKNSPPASRRNSSQSQKQIGKDNSGVTQLPDQVVQADECPNVPPTPAVIPLPLPILCEEDDDDDVSSVATRADSDHFSLGPRSPQMDLSHLRLSMVSASSLAATCDERLEEEDAGLPELAEKTAKSPLSSDPTNDTPSDDSANVEASATNQLNSSKVRGSLESSSLGTNTVGNSTPNSTPPPLSNAESVAQQPTPLLPQDLVPASYPKSKSSSSVSRHDIQIQCSKVVKTYRTNEWAKHLAEADKPELDELPVTQAVESDEKPAPLDIQELKGTADTIPKPISRNESRGSIYNTAVGPSAAVPAPAHRTSLRRSSTPFPGHPIEIVSAPTEQSPLPTAVEQPRQGSLIDRAVSPAAAVREEDRFPKGGTLLGQRESMVRSRASFNTLARYDSPSPSSTPVSRGSGEPPRSASAISFGNKPKTPPRRQTPNPQVLNDDMPLADRQHLLQQSLSQLPLARRSWNSLPQVTVLQRRGTPMPLQQYPDKRAEMLNGWREGIRADQYQQESVNVVDQRRAEMLDERNQAAMMERQKMIQGNLRGSLMEERMRQKDMLELHNEAIRRIQATANRNAR